MENTSLVFRHIDNRIAISKLRLSNHGTIEKVRHLKIDRTLRFCPFCPNHMETEQPFLYIVKHSTICGENNYEKWEIKSPF